MGKLCGGFDFGIALVCDGEDLRWVRFRDEGGIGKVMGKRGSSQKKGSKNPTISKRRPRDQHVNPQDMDDEIDACISLFTLFLLFFSLFINSALWIHKMRDVVPLDTNADVGDSDEDNDHPVFDFQLKSSDDESLAEEEEEVLRMQKERANTLEMEDFGLQDVSDSDRELTLEEISVKGKSTRKSPPRKETEDDIGTTYEEVKKDLNALSKEEQMDVVYSSAPELVGLLSELNDALEQLENKVNPLLSKISDSFKVKEQEVKLEGGICYLEVKQLLLLAYCQAITFYLLLKSEGQPVRDHPVIARLVEIKGLLDKVYYFSRKTILLSMAMKELDGNLPSEVDEFLKKDHTAETGANLIAGKEVVASAPVTKYQYETPHLSADAKQASLASDPNELDKGESLGNNENKGGGKRRRQNDQVGVQSLEMLKIRAALEEKLKQKGVFSSIAPKPDIAKKRLKPVNGQLETHDDFDDDAMDVERSTLGLSNGHVSSSCSSKLSQFATARPNKAKVKKKLDVIISFWNKPNKVIEPQTYHNTDQDSKPSQPVQNSNNEDEIVAATEVISGDDDLPKRDDIGERRRKHELRVLAGAGIKFEDDDAGEELGTPNSDEDGDMEEGDTGESEDEFYKQVKQQRAAKHAAKAEIYTRTSAIPSLPESADGKRQISYQIEKNRGLTRARKKLLKNPRKKYRSKHEKAVVRRKGQEQSKACRVVSNFREQIRQVASEGTPLHA
ncbi:hypothetical protein EZV62_002178 [Acer yangbiense]|uniref:Sas10 C-terminal domain-containing protein n=1 Tax=Acer yangbiense TaxID=1000413 RepID=A0A5C7IWX3_9ROSI|nr:hypothetical protein EZV62_002178 [Acer yangbiense]